MADRSTSPTILATIAALLLTGCGPSPSKSPPAATVDSIAPVRLGVQPGAPTCPATGLWATCSILYRFDRSGIAPRMDSTDKVEERALSAPQTMVLKFGANSKLELFIYPDSAARIKDGAKLDRSALVNASATLTIKRERTLIENANVIGLLTSLNDRLRERVSDAIAAGAPQPPEAVKIK